MTKELKQSKITGSTTLVYHCLTDAIDRLFLKSKIVNLSDKLLDCFIEHGEKKVSCKPRPTRTKLQQGVGWSSTTLQGDGPLQIVYADDLYRNSLLEPKAKCHAALYKSDLVSCRTISAGIFCFLP